MSWHPTGVVDQGNAGLSWRAQANHQSQVTSDTIQRFSTNLNQTARWNKLSSRHMIMGNWLHPLGYPLTQLGLHKCGTHGNHCAFDTDDPLIMIMMMTR